MGVNWLYYLLLELRVNITKDEAGYFLNSIDVIIESDTNIENNEEWLWQMQSR